MKKIYLICIGFAFLFAVQTVQSQNDPTKLAKVVYPYQVFNFYDNGLVKEVRSETEVLQQDFEYDASNNLTRHRIYSNGVLSRTSNYIYDSNNGLILNGDNNIYDESTRTLISYGTNYNDPPPLEDEEFFYIGRKWIFNSEGYPVYKSDLIRSYLGDYEDYIYRIGSTNGNTNSVHNGESESATFWQHVTVQNPLKAAFMPVCKTLGMFASEFDYQTTWKFITTEYTSNFLVGHQKYYSEDPESDEFYYELNAIGLPVKQFRRFYYLGQYEMTRLEATYYYQGDTLP